MKFFDPKLLSLFEAEQREHLRTVRTLLTTALDGPALAEVFRAVHTLKGAARAVGVGSTELLAHRLETVFARVRDKAAVLDKAAVATVYRVLDSIEDVLAAVLENREEPDVSPVLEAIEGVLGIAAAGAPSAPAAPAEKPARRERPIDMLRVSAKSVDDLIRSASQVLAASAGSAKLHQLAAQMHQDACQIRMTPAGDVFDPFRKMVRDLAQGESKEVEFRVEGMDVLADRLVLQQLKDPVMHLLRNAISHGIESPQERIAAGKPRAGAVQLRLEARGDRLNVTIEDDGRGIDFRRVAEVAVSRGLITPDAAASQSPRELARFILEPGFSTSKAITNLAGRGMGLSVVQNGVARLEGEVSIGERQGAGTSILISAPLSISTHHVLLVACGPHTFGIPARAIGRLCRVKLESVESIEGREAIRVDGRPVPLARLGDLVEEKGTDAISRGADRGSSINSAREMASVPFSSVVVLRSGVGLVVDALLEEREAVVKDLGIPATIAGMSTGGIPLEDGTVAVILNTLALTERFRKGSKAPLLNTRRTEAPKKVHRILVVDDSITTRSLEKSILEAHGYQVAVAVDGVEALERLRAEPADLVIADVMMPRMDGFQLVQHIKQDEKLAHIPVIIVTSLDQRQERERGMSLGADAYIVKQKFDQRELLDVVRQIL